MARRSGLLEICIGVYQNHFDDGTGMCATCPPLMPITDCVPRHSSAKVIAAHGLDPVKFDHADLLGRTRYIRAEFGWQR